jgi:hypothetical protein
MKHSFKILIENTIKEALMGYFEIPKQAKPKLPGLKHPHQLIIKELIESDEPVPVPVDWAIENVFVDFSLETFCELYHLEYSVVTYKVHNLEIPRAFYLFNFKSE